tara:strand:+ start:475 stop:747 length:273 start_codon:yes stop_codon:yes gene_type:complete
VIFAKIWRIKVNGMNKDYATSSPYLCQEMGLTQGTDVYGQCINKLIDEIGLGKLLLSLTNISVVNPNTIKNESTIELSVEVSKYSSKKSV